ncbi:hypothetical protein RFI_12826, partial [Reticulomyxa filosa]
MQHYSGRPKDILTFLVSLDDTLLQSLYKDEYCVLAVFRSLRGLAKQYIMNIISLDNAIPQRFIEKWVHSTNTSRSHHKAAIHKLQEMRILMYYKSNDSYSMNPFFRKCLLQVLMAGSSCQQILCHSDSINTVVQIPTKEKLDKHAKDMWEQILNTLLDSKIGTLSELLSEVNLMKKHDSNKYEITGEGFRFLFQDIHSQIWQIIIGYLRGCKNRDLQEEDVLKFLLRLSFLTPEKGYSCTNLTPTQSVLARVINLFSFLFFFKLKYINKILGFALLWSCIQEERFYPTHLSKHLSVGHSLTKKERDSRGFIIVETTFKIYAYTNSELQIGLLTKFARLEVRLPNMVSGKITKNSIMEAIQKGIPVDMIIDYLEEYAHPLMRNKCPVLPINVMDQMRLWESETKRLHMQEAVLIYGIPNTETFEELAQV